MYVGIGLSVNLFSLMCCLMYRIRYYLWYTYMKTRLNRQKLKAVTDCEKYTYNVFISCEHRDAKLFVKRRLFPTLETKETKLNFV